MQWPVDHAASALAIAVQLQNPFIGTRSGSGASALSGVVDSELVDPDGLPPPGSPGSTLATYTATPSSGNVDSTLHMTGTLRTTAMTTLPAAVPEPGTALLVSAGIAASCSTGGSADAACASLTA